MPVRLSELVANVKQLVVEIDEFELNIDYRPNVITLQDLADIEARQNGMVDGDRGDALDFTCEQLERFIAGWDLLDENDKPFPVTVETLRNLPGRLITFIFDAVRAETQRQQDEKKAPSATSGDGLPQEDRRGNARNGTPSFAPRATSASRRGK